MVFLFHWLLTEKAVQPITWQQLSGVRQLENDFLLKTSPHRNVKLMDLNYFLCGMVVDPSCVGLSS